MSNALNIGGAPASLEQAFETPAAATEFSWLLALGDLPSVDGGAHQISPVGVPSASAVGSFSVNGTIAPVGVPSRAAVGAFSVNGTLAFTGVPSHAAAGSPEVRATIAPAGVSSAAAAGAFSVNGTLAFTGVPSAAAVGAFGVNGTIALVGVPSSAAVGRPTVGEEAPGEEPALPGDSVGGSLAPYIAVRSWAAWPSHRISPKGIPSSAVAGRPTVVHGRTARSRRREEAELMRLAA